MIASACGSQSGMLARVSTPISSRSSGPVMSAPGGGAGLAEVGAAAGPLAPGAAAGRIGARGQGERDARAGQQQDHRDRGRRPDDPLVPHTGTLGERQSQLNDQIWIR